ncbi:hypothetical protein COLO4_23890 [Corchorus olitorius]|uniref:Uncharacterized protein n=1 Tax=Corchorus olitorius TaxID=93759 RepID=A0A1R3IE68_9ROSI|nr:hypothetical protein COLO4_23890 [Corchorus olitorius]
MANRIVPLLVVVSILAMDLVGSMEAPVHLCCFLVHHLVSSQQLMKLKGKSRIMLTKELLS